MLKNWSDWLALTAFVVGVGLLTWAATTSIKADTKSTPVELAAKEAISVINGLADAQIEDLMGLMREQHDKGRLSDDEVYTNVLGILDAIKETEHERKCRITTIIEIATAE